MANMNMPDSWKNENGLIEHLADQLIAGRLGLFLGAGASDFFGLPNWQTLVTRIATSVGEGTPPVGFNPINKAEALRVKYFAERPSDFNAAVKNALYQGKTLDFSVISQNRLLSAVGSLVMASRRGSAAKVFTLNFDDLLELYLEFHGFTTATVHDACHWAQKEDVVIYHPHGFLPLAHTEESESIVLGTTSFHEIMLSDSWRPIIETALRQHSFLYIGISGDDIHLQSHWTNLKTHHAILKQRICYHGVRFTTGAGGDDTSVITEPLARISHMALLIDAIDR